MAKRPAAKAATSNVVRALSTTTLGIKGREAVDAALSALVDPSDSDLAAIRAPLGVMFGVVTNVKYLLDPETGEVRSVLVGQFEGRNLATGETVRSARCYVPRVQELLEADYNSLPANIQGKRMPFQANIYAIHHDDEYGFRYDVDLPKRDANNDPLKALREDLTPIE